MPMSLGTQGLGNRASLGRNAAVFRRIAALTSCQPWKGEAGSITGRTPRLGILFPTGEANLTGFTRQKLPAQAVGA